MVGLLIGHSFASGLHDRFSPTDLARRVSTSDHVDCLLVVGTRGGTVVPPDPGRLYRVIR